MLDVLGNIDVVNDIVQEGIQGVLGRSISVRSGLYQGDGYAVDSTSKGSASMTFRVRTQNLQTLCTISLSRKDIIIRYNHKFWFKVNLKDGLVSTSLFDEPFMLQEIKTAFEIQSNIGLGLPLKVEFDCDKLIQTILLCGSLHGSFISYISMLE
ncbi:hypothetical protein EJP02_063 [Escherichia phage EJP2]|nr:hypothetical protein EJP02_063 [Escherichia phage EJP2]